MGPPVLFGQRPQFRRQGEGDEEVRHRQQLLLLTGQPGFCLVLLAPVAGPVAAAARLGGRVPAVGAMQQQLAVLPGATAGDGMDGRPLRGAERAPLTGQQGRQVLAGAQRSKLHVRSPSGW